MSEKLSAEQWQVVRDEASRMGDCICEEPLIRCDGNGCHCVLCNRPERVMGDDWYLDMANRRAAIRTEASMSDVVKPLDREAVARAIHASKLLQPAAGPWRAPEGATEQRCLSAADAILALLPVPSEPVALPPIETDPHDPSREYIPLPGGWEVQTKGRGSSYRLCDTKTGERYSILSGKDFLPLQEFFTRFAREVYAASPSVSQAVAAEADWTVDDTLTARAILEYLGIGSSASLEPGDRRRDKIASIIQDRVAAASAQAVGRLTNKMYRPCCCNR